MDQENDKNTLSMEMSHLNSNNGEPEEVEQLGMCIIFINIFSKDGIYAEGVTILSTY